MSAVYVVVAVDNSADLTTCEVYAGVQAALGRAFALAHYSAIMNYDWVDTSPKEQKMPDGSIKWVFLDTNKKYIAVHYKNILLSSLSKKDIFDQPLKAAMVIPPGDPVILVDPTVTADEPYDDSLPGGWWNDNKPALFEDLWEYPDEIKSVYILTESQKWALATARIMKRPNYELYLPNLGTFNQAAAIKELKAKSSIGSEIRDDECIWIEGVREDRIEALTDPKEPYNQVW